MKIAIGCDHGGFNLKKDIIEYLKKNNFDFKDYGTFNNESVDYPDYALTVSEAVAKKEFDFGILICGTGIGIGIAANKVPGIRAALCGDTFSARACREHNNANILTLGERVTGSGLAMDIVDIFLKTSFSGDARHKDRINKITSIENKYK